MPILTWGDPASRTFETGLDRGVLYPHGKPGVAWNGLISVDENGASTSSAYYVDGQKFMTTVSPKDYSAKMTAYTFPDEFGEAIGLVEAANGLFLDSQVPDSFGLCYRTQIGDAAGNKGYKLHLVYNATASLSDISHSTMTSSGVDAETFEFDLDAVPVSLPGFRPTAHAIIDSRDVDPAVLLNIENILYGYTTGGTGIIDGNDGSSVIIDGNINDGYIIDGGEEIPASLPSLEVLYDLMKYGNIIILIDNGDGTWTTEGSGNNISVDNATGEFVITLDGTNLTVTGPDGDGVYTLDDHGATLP